VGGDRIRHHVVHAPDRAANQCRVLIVLPTAFFFGGLEQIIVAVLEISRGNLFGAALFGTYGLFWVMFGAFETLYATSVPAAQLSSR
jgi:succinate-acetate transporter protein